MAKQKTQAPVIPQPPGAADTVEPASLADELPVLEAPPDLAAENAALKARIAELEAAPTPAPLPSGLVGPAITWRVDLTDAPSWIVLATDPANAWEAYRKASGVLSSIHQPTITPCSGVPGRVMPDKPVK